MTDYSRLIDADTWAFIDRTNAYYPPDTVDYSIAEQRQIYDRMCREFFAGYPAGVTAQTSSIEAASPIGKSRFAPIRLLKKTMLQLSSISMAGGSFWAGSKAMTTFAPRSALQPDTM